MHERYEVAGFSCPVVVEHQEDDGETYTVQRCKGQVFLEVQFSEPSWHGAVYVECEHGHKLETFEKFVSVDLDGVPYGA